MHVMATIATASPAHTSEGIESPIKGCTELKKALAVYIQTRNELISQVIRPAQ